MEREIDGRWYTDDEISLALTIVQTLACVKTGDNFRVTVREGGTVKGLTPFEAYFRRESQEKTVPADPECRRKYYAKLQRKGSPAEEFPPCAGCERAMDLVNSPVYCCKKCGKTFCETCGRLTCGGWMCYGCRGFGEAGQPAEKPPFVFWKTDRNSQVQQAYTQMVGTLNRVASLDSFDGQLRLGRDLHVLMDAIEKLENQK